ncbi:unnamed protein product [Miscanthus lutarioriparius]|uniref:Uncharacterized protein n=1 Tax=Miscanthus lutarioriparius TaxID=422564 RepID=A0A811Q4P0_9POAL|nr:unnamed protein product [Miscanthus lutarioriparius]
MEESRLRVATPDGGRHGGGWSAMVGAEHRPWIRLPCPRPRQGVFHDGELDLAVGRCCGAETVLQLAGVNDRLDVRPLSSFHPGKQVSENFVPGRMYNCK